MLIVLYLNQTWLLIAHFIVTIARADTKVIEDFYVKPVSQPLADNSLAG